jgi:hypothetical protein
MNVFLHLLFQFFNISCNVVRNNNSYINTKISVFGGIIFVEMLFLKKKKRKMFSSLSQRDKSGAIQATKGHFRAKEEHNKILSIK